MGIWFCAAAQQAKPVYELGVNLGFLVYQGDLTPRRFGALETQKFALGFSGAKLLSSSFAIRGNLLFGKLKGDDARYEQPEWRRQRNFYFSSPVTELSVLLAWSPLQTNYVDKGLSPYLFAGAGLSFLKIKRDQSRINPDYFLPELAEFWAGLSADSARALPRAIPVLPAGAGIKYFFRSNWALQAETAYRFSTTDYLDGFSQSANPGKRDHYFNYSVGLIYRGGNNKRLGCPVIRY